MSLMSTLHKNGRFTFIFASLFLYSSQSVAHLRWFVVEQSHNIDASFRWEWGMPIILIGAIFYLYLSLATGLAFPFKADRFSYFFHVWPKQLQWKLVSTFTGVMLIANGVNNEFIAPNIEINFGKDIAEILQYMVGGFLLLGIWHRLAGSLLLVLIIFFCLTVKIKLWIDYIFEFLAISAFLIFYKHQQFSLMLLRVGIGLQLVELAIHNKFMSPEIGLGFLQQYPWNFIKSAGFEWFSDYSFVLAAGVAEFMFGLLITLGVATRFTTLSVSFFFILTSILLGIHELIGHIPIIAIAIALISLGGGQWQITEWLICAKDKRNFRHSFHGKSFQSKKA